jgi:hypothetical protein
VLYKATQQCLTARQQAVVRVGQRKHWQKGEGLSAPDPAATANPDPIVMLFVRLLPPSPMTNNRILFTNRAAA